MQNPFEFLVSLGEEDPIANISPYDDYIDYTWFLSVQSYVNGETTREQAIENFKHKINQKYLDVKVE